MGAGRVRLRRSYDEATGRYRGLRTMETISLTDTDPGLVVRPEVARRQIDAEAAAVNPAIQARAVAPNPKAIAGSMTTPRVRRPSSSDPRPGATTARCG